MTGEPVVCDAQEMSIIFEKLPMKSTIVTEFNLFCNEEYKVKFSTNHDYNKSWNTLEINPEYTDK